MKPIVFKIMGFSRIIFNILWIALGVAGIIYGLKGINFVEVAMINNFNGVDENIEFVKKLLGEAVDVIEKVDQSLSTIEKSSIDAGLSLIETRPMINKTSQVVTKDLPQAVDDMQTSMPSVIEAAAMIDQTLYILSRFRFNIPNPFGTDFEVSLGVDYTPSIPLEDALVQLSGNLEGIPDRMRSIEGDLVKTDFNLSIMSENLIDTAYDIDLLREQVAEITPEFEKMISNLEDIRESIEKTKESLPRTFSITRKVFIGLMILFILSQGPSVFTGYLLVKEAFYNPIGIEKGENHV